MLAKCGVGSVVQFLQWAGQAAIDAFNTSFQALSAGWPNRDLRLADGAPQPMDHQGARSSSMPDQ